MKLKFARPVAVALSSALLASVLTTSVFAQETFTPGADAPAPQLPPAGGPPPNSTLPGTAVGDPTRFVINPFFGPSAVVIQLLLPERVRATAPIGCHSGPDATAEESQASILFGVKPAGTEFITFFVRGTRTYAFDTSTSNYCWIEPSFTEA